MPYHLNRVSHDTFIDQRLRYKSCAQFQVALTWIFVGDWIYVTAAALNLMYTTTICQATLQSFLYPYAHTHAIPDSPPPWQIYKQYA